MNYIEFPKMGLHFEITPQLFSIGPFTIHWYEGAVPPLTGVAVKVIVSPAQAVPDGLAAKVTPATIMGMF